MIEIHSKDGVDPAGYPGFRLDVRKSINVEPVCSAAGKINGCREIRPGSRVAVRSPFTWVDLARSGGVAVQVSRNKAKGYGPILLLRFLRNTGGHSERCKIQYKG